MFSEILQAHLDRYPEMQIQDIYKLIHQATMGSGHAVRDVVIVRKWLERELAEMGDGPPESVIDPISVDEEISRIHLRPYIFSGGNIGILLDAFVRTGNEFLGDADTLEAIWVARFKRCLFLLPLWMHLSPR